MNGQQLTLKDFPILLYAILGFCVFSIFFPRQAWWFDGGWWLHGDYEPTKWRLFLRRLGGIIGTIAIVYFVQRK